MRSFLLTIVAPAMNTKKVVKYCNIFRRLAKQFACYKNSLSCFYNYSRAIQLLVHRYSAPLFRDKLKINFLLARFRLLAIILLLKSSKCVKIFIGAHNNFRTLTIAKWLSHRDIIIIIIASLKSKSNSDYYCKYFIVTALVLRIIIVITHYELFNQAALAMYVYSPLYTHHLRSGWLSVMSWHGVSRWGHNMNGTLHPWLLW